MVQILLDLLQRIKVKRDEFDRAQMAAIGSNKMYKALLFKTNVK